LAKDRPQRGQVHIGAGCIQVPPVGTAGVRSQGNGERDIAAD
jgi:hypothetical protein